MLFQVTYGLRTSFHKNCVTRSPKSNLNVYFSVITIIKFNIFLIFEIVLELKLKFLSRKHYAVVAAMWKLIIYIAANVHSKSANRDTII